jgi:glutaredoxin
MNIQVYTIPGCTYCVKLKRLLDRDNIAYIQTVVDDTVSFKLQHPKCSGFPFTVIDGEEIGGIMDTAKFLLDKGLVKRRK